MISTSLPAVLSGGLLDSTGAAVDGTALSGKRVALYFTAGWCPMCTSFEPALDAFRSAAEADGAPVELIYVSSDRSASDAMARAATLGTLQVPFGEASDTLKRDLRVWAGMETMRFGMLRRSGVPALVVLNPAGEEVAFLDAERRGAAALKKWPAGGQWP